MHESRDPKDAIRLIYLHLLVCLEIIVVVGYFEYLFIYKNYSLKRIITWDI